MANHERIEEKDVLSDKEKIRNYKKDLLKYEKDKGNANLILNWYGRVKEGAEFVQLPTIDRVHSLHILAPEFF